ncbi:hypothetical protein BYT27DRAFT_7270575 [Phlegmacium glaucopus]|nr:hypothetical protein BYT27DRAFT_7270575 [Phlegmacium glaucopus]
MEEELDNEHDKVLNEKFDQGIDLEVQDGCAVSTGVQVIAIAIAGNEGELLAACDAGGCAQNSEDFEMVNNTPLIDGDQGAENDQNGDHVNSANLDTSPILPVKVNSAPTKTSDAKVQF